MAYAVPTRTLQDVRRDRSGTTGVAGRRAPRTQHRSTGLADVVLKVLINQVVGRRLPYDLRTSLRELLASTPSSGRRR